MRTKRCRDRNKENGKRKISKSNSSFKSRIVTINIEKIFVTAFFISFSLLIITQVMLTITDLREGISTNSSIEGVPLEKEEFLYKEGEIVLELLSEYKSQGKDIKILVNGEEIGDFEYGQLSFKVKDGDILEIDSTRVSNRIDFIIKNKSSNVKIDNLSKKYTANREVLKIIKVKII